MTFQPPPPPPPAPPPPGGGYGPPPASGGGGGFDPKAVNVLDWALLGVGFLTLIFSFFGFYTAKVDGAFGGSASKSYSAWHEIFGGGFFGWIAMILAVLGTAALAVTLFAPTVKLPMPGRVLAVIGFGAGFICEILAIFIHMKFYDESSTISGVTFKASFGHGFSFWISLVLLAAGTVLAIMRAQQTNTALPGPLNSIPKIG